MNPKILGIRLAGLLLSASLLAACSTVRNPVTGRQEASVMDEAAEIAEGKKGHEQVLAEYGALDHPRLQAYVNELGQKLARSSHRQNLTWHFTVLDSPEVNAFALPGGYVYVTRGIMAYLDSEADLAGVIGHEIGHVTARHGAQRATREQAAGLGVFAATVLGAVLESQGMSGAGQTLGQLSQGAAAGYVASYSRDQELQADRLGAEYLVRSQYNPQNMVDVIGVLKSQERYAADSARAAGRQPSEGGNWLASHPSNDQRLAEITRAAASYQQGRYADDGRERYLQAIAGLPFGESRNQGITRGRNFYHEPLGIALSAPEGWSVQNSSEAITVVNAAQDAGLVVRLVPPQAGATHEEIVRAVFKPTQGRLERRSLNGLSASHFEGTATNAQGQTGAVQATVVTGPENRNYVMLYSARDAAAMQRALPGLRQAETGFRALTAADRAAARPWILRTTTLPAGGFAELARQSALGAGGERQLRLLNGVYGGGEMRPGQRVKTVE